MLLKPGMTNPQTTYGSTYGCAGDITIAQARLRLHYTHGANHPPTYVSPPRWKAIVTWLNRNPDAETPERHRQRD